MAEHVCSKMGRAAARRDARKQPRAIRAGPHPGGKKIGLPIPGVYLIVLIPEVDRISREKSGGLSDCAYGEKFKSGGLSYCAYVSFFLSPGKIR